MHNKFSYEISFVVLVLIGSVIGLQVCEDEKKTFKFFANCFVFGLFMFLAGIGGIYLNGGVIDSNSICDYITWKKLDHGRLPALVSMGFMTMTASFVLYLTYSVKNLFLSRKSS